MKEKLISLAREAAGNAYCKYSNFAVGAALLAEDGTIWLGCNVENSSYGATNCAERTALFSAIAAGKRKFLAIAIAGGSAASPASPCGICRQVLSEFCPPEMPVYFAGLDGDAIQTTTLGELLPFAFSGDSLK
jgi:cytidine deaminase